MGVGVSTRPRLTVAELEELDVRDAWSHYLSATRDLGRQRYEEVEPWAWDRLQARLARIRKRGRALRAPAHPVGDA